MEEIFFTIRENSDGEFEARALDYSIFTSASSIEEIKETIKDSVSCHFEPHELPRLINLHFVRDEIISL